jgi:hypothetical protein
VSQCLRAAAGSHELRAANKAREISILLNVLTLKQRPHQISMTLSLLMHAEGGRSLKTKYQNVPEQRGMIIGAVSATELIRETIKTRSPENPEP